MSETLPGILAIFNNAAPGREAEFEEWFQHEHLAERVAVPGFLLAGHGLYAWGATAADARRHVEALEFLLACRLEERRLR